jgi:NAD(P)H dehydrogenase (quinone)
MAKVLIVYYSRTGNTRQMAKLVEEGIRAEGIDVETKDVEDVKTNELLNAEGIIFGSPTYYGGMAAPLKKLLDESVEFHGKLKGKVGAAFSSSANIGGGNETTVLGILNAFLIHGMVVQGDASDDHYGPVAIGAPDKRASEQCRRLGQKVARLVKKVC